MIDQTPVVIDRSHGVIDQCGSHGDRSMLLDAMPIRATLPLWQHPDALPSTSGSRPVIAARPSRTSYSRSRRLLDGLAGRSWRSTATRASVAPRGATSGLDWMLC